MPSAAPLTFTCPAKVNLALSVGPSDATGYHLIASWMVALAFGDRLTLTRLADGPTTWAIAFDPAGPAAAQRVDWPLDDDLAVRAHRLVEHRVGRPLPIDARLAKHVPTGAGLGGGSSAAAATLLAVDHLFELHLGEATLRELAAQLGSDVPFLVAALHGSPAALVTGVGHVIEPTTLPQPIHLALAMPAITCPTGEVYLAFDEQAASPVDTPRVSALARRGLPVDAELFNDLAMPATRVRPALADLRGRLARELDRAVHVTGSGAALFVLARDADDAAAVAARITVVTDAPAIATRTP
ncbi:MAG: 4-(cytidine 5'-diphospho)-2-C-methyl-D-erythritol kinase [Phycisphaeraceae bacterium]